MVGIQSKHYSQGEDPVAYVTVSQKRDTESILKKIQSLCKEKLADYQIPIDIMIVDELPLTKVGKIDYLTLENMYSK